MTKETIHQKDVRILNISASSYGGPMLQNKHEWAQKVTEGPHSNREGLPYVAFILSYVPQTKSLQTTIRTILLHHWPYLSASYRIFLPVRKHTFYKIGHIGSHKAKFNTVFKKEKNSSCISWGQHRIKLRINSKENTPKWRVNHAFWGYGQ